MQEFQRSPIKEIREIGIQVLEIHSKLAYLLKLKKQQQYTVGCFIIIAHQNIFF